MTKVLTRNLTSYDFFKTAAILLMLVDHVGDYFFEDQMWLRVVGRLCVPIWFFLIGYARSRDMGWRMWAGMAILVVANLVTGLGALPLNILGTMLFIRWSIDYVMRGTQRDQNVFWAIFFILSMLTVPTSFMFEYGVLGLIVAMFGYMVRAYQDGAERYGRPVSRNDVQVYMVASMFVFLLLQYVSFGFSHTQLMVLAAGISVVMFLLYGFSFKEYPELTVRMPRPVVGFFQLFGRRTLEIYVIHLLLFKTAGLLFVDDERFEFLRATIFSYGVMESFGLLD